MAVVLVTLLSGCSWLYPLNPWDDSNVFATIAKSMLEGKVLYRDVFDQKGPLLFLVHALGAWCFTRPFLGIYLLEILCVFVTMVYGLKTMRIFRQNVIQIPLMLVIEAFYLSSDFFYYGDSVEELSMPILAYSLYHFMRYARWSKVPNLWSSFVLGIGFAAVFWMKFTVLAMPLGSVVATMVLASKRGEWRQILPTIGGILAGFVAMTTVVLLCFVPQGAVGDVLEGYFGYNLFHYHLYSEDTVSESGFYPMRWLLFAILVLPLCFLKIDRDVKLMVVMSWAFSLVLLAVTTVYIYYFSVLFVMFPLMDYPLRRVLDKRFAPLTLCVCMIACVCTSYNFISLLRGTYPTAILEVAEDLKNEDAEAGILQYHTRETGIYPYSQFSTPTRIFFQMSVVHQEYLDEQEEALMSGKCKYVIVKDGTLDHGPYHLVKEYPEQFRSLFFVYPKAWLYNLTGIEALHPEAVENAIPTVLKATVSVFRLYERNEDENENDELN